MTITGQVEKITVKMLFGFIFTMSLLAIQSSNAAEKKKDHELARNPAAVAGEYTCEVTSNFRDFWELIQRNCDKEKNLSITTHPGYYVFCCIQIKRVQ